MTLTRTEKERSVGFHPLYRQVKERLVSRIATGAWQPGQIIPSEFQIADELGVSQGTVRKALDEMTADRLLVRRQGRGTFVAAHDEARILFQFFKLTRDDGGREFPDSEIVAVEQTKATDEMSEKLAIATADDVIVVKRVRSLSGEKAVSERIVIPAARFPELDTAEPVPNNLYGLYAERYGVTIAQATETLKAIACPPDDAALLGIKSGTPVLAIDRTGIDLSGRPVEWRFSLCRTDKFHYLSDLK
ncbi:HTH-type transcriptional repressor DasR [Variibacter gotjawalensis]|uniref:HTH-type transcriptional repressor DasR n=1 Tax=Variibacter gotjawalensis TaxID=1333996 RepID=A0A0S3PNU6_9BRAD|nr:GntR family transcriptional regulator [Variibacter gotjawalensis]NIK47917.1 GntR family transcriptional regulator [Variibacter gotjawalensis]RZS49795.1 GntR family transcriptional regulator [Variibacter gotjawalensis]BAT57624.1 HTH-type transcriptional repressor DasR [Variibacter gotjawalensis]